MSAAAPVAESRRFGMWVFLVTDAMSFAALLLVYAVLRARAEAWPDLGARLSLPLATGATIALFGSSLTLLRGRVGATLALGGLFLVAQAIEYALLVRHGVGFGTDQAASVFFATTGWHGLHVLAAIIVLAAARRSAAAALFWQFVDAVWIVLFTVFYLAPAVPHLAGAALGLVAAAGFGAIVLFAMNLRGEGRAVRVVFVLPLVLPVVYTVALVADALTRGIRP